MTSVDPLTIISQKAMAGATRQAELDKQMKEVLKVAQKQDEKLLVEKKKDLAKVTASVTKKAEAEAKRQEQEARSQEHRELYTKITSYWADSLFGPMLHAANMRMPAGNSSADVLRGHYDAIRGVIGRLNNYDRMMAALRMVCTTIGNFAGYILVFTKGKLDLRGLPLATENGKYDYLLDPLARELVIEYGDYLVSGTKGRAFECFGNVIKEHNRFNHMAFATEEEKPTCDVAREMADRLSRENDKDD